MATHIYIPPEPPTLWNRMTAHAVEVVLCAYGIIIGLLVALNANDKDLMSRSPLAALPGDLVLAIGTLVFLGASMALVGLLVRRRDIRRELNVEQIGWLAYSLGWAGYGIAAATLVEGSGLAVASALIMVWAGIWRAYALWKVERALDELEV